MPTYSFQIARLVCAHTDSVLACFSRGDHTDFLLLVLFELIANRKILLNPTNVIEAPNHGRAREEKLLSWDIGAHETKCKSSFVSFWQYFPHSCDCFPHSFSSQKFRKMSLWNKYHSLPCDFWKFVGKTHHSCKFLGHERPSHDPNHKVIKRQS